MCSIEEVGARDGAVAVVVGFFGFYDLSGHVVCSTSGMCDVSGLAQRFGGLILIFRRISEFSFVSAFQVRWTGECIGAFFTVRSFTSGDSKFR